MSEETVTIRYTVQADATETLRVPRAKWEAWSQEDRDAYMKPFMESLAADCVADGTSYEEV
ncbi:hypothetical protein [Nonomuraea sp. NPDC050643]|uniref:hypothetical protein n=1 Tax=Nonomuraea sp. NPDC050643 TaxID=3155660 RepID=UPI0033F7687B